MHKSHPYFSHKYPFKPKLFSKTQAKITIHIWQMSNPALLQSWLATLKKMSGSISHLFILSLAKWLAASRQVSFWTATATRIALNWTQLYVYILYYIYVHCTYIANVKLITKIDLVRQIYVLWNFQRYFLKILFFTYFYSNVITISIFFLTTCLFTLGLKLLYVMV